MKRLPHPTTCPAWQLLDHLMLSRPVALAWCALCAGLVYSLHVDGSTLEAYFWSVVAGTFLKEALTGVNDRLLINKLLRALDLSAEVINRQQAALDARLPAKWRRR